MWMWVGLSRLAQAHDGYLKMALTLRGFAGGSVVKNLSAAARDTGFTPGLGRSPGKGNGNPLQYFFGFPRWHSAKSIYLLMQEMQEMRVRSLDGKGSPEVGMATHSSILAWKIPWTEATDGLQSIGLQRVGHD